MWFILCRALKQLSAGAGSRTAAKTALFNVYFWHSQKKLLQKLSAACRWIFLRLVLLQSENRPATYKVLKAEREKHKRVFMQTNPLHRENHYFMCSSISPRASSVVPHKRARSQNAMEQWQQKTIMFAISTVVWLFVNSFPPFISLPYSTDVNTAKLINATRIFTSNCFVKTRPIKCLLQLKHLVSKKFHIFCDCSFCRYFCCWINDGIDNNSVCDCRRVCSNNRDTKSCNSVEHSLTIQLWFYLYRIERLTLSRDIEMFRLMFMTLHEIRFENYSVVQWNAIFRISSFSTASNKKWQKKSSITKIFLIKILVNVCAS